jgi:hypothetical protein
MDEPTGSLGNVSNVYLNTLKLIETAGGEYYFPEFKVRPTNNIIDPKGMVLGVVDN